MKEAWKPVVGFEEFYEVSSLGRVRRARHAQYRHGSSPGRHLKREIPKNGYPTVHLCANYRKKTARVHRLVCEAFHGPSLGREVRHKDGVRTNAKASNLRWGTSSENREDARRHGTLAVGEVHGHTVFGEQAARQIYKRVWSGAALATLAKEFHVSIGTISNIKLGKTWSAATGHQR